MAAVFLDRKDIIELTNKKAKGKQIDTLRRMGIPFFVNSTGHPVVTRSAVEGKPEAEQPVKKTWVPKVLQKK